MLRGLEGEDLKVEGLRGGGSQKPRCCWGLQGSGVPLSNSCTLVYGAKSECLGAQAALPLAPRPGHSAASGWDGPLVPWSLQVAGGVQHPPGEGRCEGEVSLPLCPLLSPFLRPALFGDHLPHPPGIWVGRENHSPGLRGEDPRVPGWGVLPRWGLALGSLRSGCCWNDRWSD